MLRGILKSTALAGAATAAVIGTAAAGGLERGGYNIDLLFDPSPFAFDSSFTYVMPDRTLKNVRDTDTSVPPIFAGPGRLPGRGGGDLNGRSDSVKESENYLIPRLSAKINVVEPVDCLFDYSQPWGAHTNPGVNWAGANSNIETKVNSNNFAATCSYKFNAGPGDFRIIGGAFWQEVYGFKERLVVDPALLAGLPLPFTLSGVGRLDLAGEGYGWRAGVAYEVPEIALRASLVYNSEVDLGDITGTVDLSQTGAAFAPIPVHGTATMPDSLEFKLQSGVAPGWLIFGSAKWVDWSQLQTVPFYCDSGVAGVCATNGEVTSLDLLYRDGYTITGGIGHKFNDAWSGALALNWDRGTSQGYGSRTDTWSISGGASFTPNDRVEFRLGALAGILTSGHSGAVTRDGVTYGDDVSYDFDDDFVGALSIAARVKF